MKRVYIASPFRGATKEETRQNIVYARLCMLDSLDRGEAPYLSHLLYTQAWSEHRRTDGLAAGDAWREVSELVAAYTDLGRTGGMQRALLAAAHRNIPTASRLITLPGIDPEQLRTPEAWRAQLAKMLLEDFTELA